MQLHLTKINNFHGHMGKCNHLHHLYKSSLVSKQLWIYLWKKLQDPLQREKKIIIQVAVSMPLLNVQWV